MCAGFKRLMSLSNPKRLYSLRRDDLPSPWSRELFPQDVHPREIIRHPEGRFFVTPRAFCLGPRCLEFSSVHGNLPMEPHVTNNLSAFSFDGTTAGKQSADAFSDGSYPMGSALGGPVARARSQEQKNSPLTGRREQKADLQGPKSNALSTGQRPSLFERTKSI